MNILAIDTSFEACSAALLTQGRVLQQYVFAPRQHAQLILPMIEALLDQSSLKLENLDALAFAAGPGSFTGIRIAASVIQGLAFAVNLPVVAVSTLQTMAQQAWNQYQAEKVIVGVDARMGEVYWGVYQLDSDRIMQPISQDALCRPEEMIAPTSMGYIFLGDAWFNYSAAIQPKLRHVVTTIPAEWQPRAESVVNLAQHYFKQGVAVKAENALPVYLRSKGAWKTLEEQ